MTDNFDPYNDVPSNFEGGDGGFTGFGFDIDEFVVKMDGTFPARFLGYEKAVNQNNPEFSFHRFKFQIEDESNPDVDKKFVAFSLYMHSVMTAEIRAHLSMTDPKKLQMFDINYGKLRSALIALGTPGDNIGKVNPNIHTGRLYMVHAVHNEQTGYDEVKKFKEADKSSNPLNGAQAQADDIDAQMNG